jgi:hypothetical protein
MQSMNVLIHTYAEQKNEKYLIAGGGPHLFLKASLLFP